MRIYDCPTPSDLGRVITPDGVARILYSVYVLGVLVLGAVQVAYTGAGAPVWLSIEQQVALYFGAPVAGLAGVNTMHGKYAKD